MFVTATTTEFLSDPPGTYLWSIIRSLVDFDPPGSNDTASFLRSIGSRNDVIDSHLVYEVFLLYLGSMDQNFTMPNRSQDATCVLTHTLRDGFPLQVTIAIAGCSKEIKETRLIRHKYLVDPPLEQATVVPSEPQ